MKTTIRLFKTVPAFLLNPMMSFTPNTGHYQQNKDCFVEESGLFILDGKGVRKNNWGYFWG